eukprot:GHVP01023649.1.p1 GENE.GHVP01023649.1~~GHVP01023649.1.p1  ORF type:complete len:475 (-),score=89.79 GHVP01023649.1:166-1590(-)
MEIVNTIYKMLILSIFNTIQAKWDYTNKQPEQRANHAKDEGLVKVIKKRAEEEVKYINDFYKNLDERVSEVDEQETGEVGQIILKIGQYLGDFVYCKNHYKEASEIDKFNDSIKKAEEIQIKIGKRLSEKLKDYELIEYVYSFYSKAGQNQKKIESGYSDDLKEHLFHLINVSTVLKDELMKRKNRRDEKIKNILKENKTDEETMVKMKAKKETFDSAVNYSINIVSDYIKKLRTEVALMENSIGDIEDPKVKKTPEAVEEYINKVYNQLKSGIKDFEVKTKEELAVVHGMLSESLNFLFDHSLLSDRYTNTIQNAFEGIENVWRLFLKKLNTNELLINAVQILDHPIIHITEDLYLIKKMSCKSIKKFEDYLKHHLNMLICLNEESINRKDKEGNYILICNDRKHCDEIIKALGPSIKKAKEALGVLTSIRKSKESFKNTGNKGNNTRNTGSNQATNSGNTATYNGNYTGRYN